MLDWIYTNLGSISQIILYIIIFCTTFSYIYIAANKEHILNNWNEYRFKPYIIPIAGFLKPENNISAYESSIKNLADILWALLKKFFDLLIKPIQYLLDIIKKILGDVSKVIDKIRQQIKIMRNFLISIVMNMMKRIENIIAASIFTFGKINDMTKRQLGIYQNLVYMLETFAVTLTTFISGSFGKLIDVAEVGIWTLPIFTLGVPGIAFPLMAVCFTPHTIILTKNGDVPISNIKIGDILVDGSVVISKMKFINIHNICEYNGDYVSGTHYVFENNNIIRVSDSVKSREVEYSGYLYNINTSNNLIYSKNNKYLDYDEYNSRNMSEIENSSFLEKLNNCVHLKNIESIFDEKVRYKIGLGFNTLISGRKVENIELGSRLNDNRYVIGIAAHKLEPSDKIYMLEDVCMTEWVKLFYNNSWICIRDHPDSVLIDYKYDKLYSIITTDHTIQLDNGILIRDFLEC
jgi:hypothetical protein